jgi:hypothetical protein
MHENVYFAQLPKEQIAERLNEKVANFFDEIDRNGRLGLWRRAHRQYFALDAQGVHEASEISRGGEQGELSLIKANHYRNLLQHLHVLVTQNRPAFECRAINTDYESQVQTILGRNILEYYVRERRLDLHYRLAAEYALAYGEAYVELEWDMDAGDEVAVDAEGLVFPPGHKVKTGDIVVRTYDPINVIRRCRADVDGQQDWYILRRRENRYDLAAQHPDEADAILGHGDSDASERLHDYGYEQVDQDDDMIPVFTLFHARTKACPNGRRVKFLSSNVCLEYGDLEYAEMPVYSMIPQQQHGTSFGYSVGFDLLCVQEAVDLMYSTILSNQATFGVQNIWMKPGSNLMPSQLGGGLNVLESMEKPEPINLTHTPPEIFNFLKGLETLGEVLSGVNSVARGQPEASLKSGSALALVASQAVQFSNGLQAAYVRLQEDSATGILRMLQRKAALPRATVVAGKDNRTYVKDFTGKQLQALNRVIVDTSNPMSQTLPGRMQMAQDMTQMGATPEQYYQVLATGRIDPLMDEKRRTSLTITAENEALREGRPVAMMITDQHVQHIQEHATVLGGNDERMNPELVDRVNAHLQEHINALRTTDPGLLQVLGQNAIAPPGMPQQPNQGASAPQPNAGGAVPAQGGPVPAPEGSPPAVAQNMPSMPTPPPTGNPAA